MADRATPGIDMPAFRRHVRARILTELATTATITRGELIARLGLSRTALTRVLEPMFAAGEVTEEDAPRSPDARRGRPPRLLSLRVPPRTTLAVQVMHDRMIVAHVDEVGTVIHSAPGLSGARDPFDRTARVIDALTRTVSARTGRTADRCIVILPTMVDPDGTSVMPRGAATIMPTWIGTTQRSTIESLTGVPTTFENDGRMSALSEGRFGAGREGRNVLCVAVGPDGIRGGILIDREIHRGSGFAGEISHVRVRDGGARCPCGLRGCVAAQLRAHAIQLAESRAGGARQDQLEPSRQRIASDAGHAIASAVSVLAPDTVVLANRFAPGVIDDAVSRIRDVVLASVPPEIAAVLEVRESTSPETGTLRAAGIVSLGL